jgi:exodeoxyribonuclease V alpha subunit
MVDVPLIRALLRRCQTELRCCWWETSTSCLRSGQGRCWLIASGAVPVVRVTEVFRQAAESRIIVNAHRINQGPMPELIPLESGDFYFVDAADAEEVVRKLLVDRAGAHSEALRARPGTRDPGARPRR